MKFQKGSVPPNFKDLMGQRFGLLTVIERAGSESNKAVWLCVCDCGKQKRVKGDLLQRGTKSCGCLRKGNTSHGMTGCKTYSIWRNMLSRCMNPKVKAYKNYGGRGISVCDRWLSFGTFLLDMGECPKGFSIERLDNNGNYDPKNCEWIPLLDQAHNKRNTVLINGERIPCIADRLNLKAPLIRYRIKNNIELDKPAHRKIRYDGLEMNQTQWAKHLGLAKSTITQRLKKGLPLSEVLREVHRSSQPH